MIRKFYDIDLDSEGAASHPSTEEVGRYSRQDLYEAIKYGVVSAKESISVEQRLNNFLPTISSHVDEAWEVNNAAYEQGYKDASDGLEAKFKGIIFKKEGKNQLFTSPPPNRSKQK